MPADRFLHPRAGHSEKVTQLSHLEYRVWTQYILSADDFGVMRATAFKLQSDNDALAQEASEAVQLALERVIGVDLIQSFVHQRQRYVYQFDWQDWQKITWPSKTIHPAPPSDVLQGLTAATQALFAAFPGGQKVLPKNSRSTSEELPENFPPRARASRAKRLMATANGSGLTATAEEQRFERFWNEYPKKVGKDAAWQAWLKRAPDDDLTDLIVTKVREHSASAQWLKDGGQFIPHPRTWLSQGRWHDQLTHTPAEKPDMQGHFPPCKTIPECRDRVLREAREEREAKA
jgi:hypothetical protein